MCSRDGGSEDTLQSSWSKDCAASGVERSCPSVACHDLRLVVASISRHCVREEDKNLKKTKSSESRLGANQNSRQTSHTNVHFVHTSPLPRPSNPSSSSLQREPQRRPSCAVQLARRNGWVHPFSFRITADTRSAGIRSSVYRDYTCSRFRAVRAIASAPLQLKHEGSLQTELLVPCYRHVRSAWTVVACTSAAGRT